MADPVSIDRLLGTYVNKEDKTKSREFFKKNNALWLKNEVFGEEYRYIGNNTFDYAGMPKGMFETYTFELLGAGGVKCTLNFMYENNQKGTIEYWKG